MVQILAATFKDGVFKPDESPALADSARVRLLVEELNGEEANRRDEAWATLQHLWESPRLDSGGDCLTRDELHERR